MMQQVFVTGASPRTSSVETRGGIPVNRNEGATYERIAARAGGYASRYKFLPYLDDINGETHEHLQAYMEMYRRDDTVRSAINQKVWAVSSLDWQSHPASDSPRDVMISEFLLYAYSKCKTSAEGIIGPVGIVEELLIPALVRKYVIAEKVMAKEVFTEGKWRGYRGIEAIKARELATLEEDGYGRITGVIGPGDGGGQQWNDPANFIIIKNLSVFGVPNSDLRPVYRWFVAKDTLLKLWLIGMEKFGTPFLKAKYPYGDNLAYAAIEAELEKARGRTYVIFPEGTDIELSEVFSSAANFESALDRCDRGIMVAVNHAFLQSQTSQTTGDRGNALVQQQTSELPIWRLAKVIESALEAQCSPDIVQENFANAETPKITLGAVNEAELEKSARLDSILLGNGYDLSMKDGFKRYGRQKAADKEDSLLEAKRRANQPPGGGMLGGMLGGMAPPAGLAPPAGPGGGGAGGAEPGADGADVPSDGSDPNGYADAFDTAGGEGDQFSDIDEGDHADEGPAEHISGVSQDSELAATLLRNAQEQGQDVLHEITAAALERLLANPRRAMQTRDLFTPEERQQLQDILQNTRAPAELLGRARILQRAQQAEQHYAQTEGRRGDDLHRVTRTFSDIPGGGEGPVVRFSSLATDMHVFNDMGLHGEAIEPLPPVSAVRYFRKLVPTLGVDPKRFGREMERQAFTLAVATEETILKRVQELIAAKMESGMGISEAAADIDDTLASLGVSPQNPQYSEMVFRTNMMDAYNTGAQRQLSDSSDMFPAWQYSNPDDGRSRPEHAALNGRYFPSSVPFNTIRGTDIGSVANCRCVPIPIDKFEWSDLQRAGAQFEHVPGDRALKKFSALWSRYRGDLHYFNWVETRGPRGGVILENTETGKILRGPAARRVLVEKAPAPPQEPKAKRPRAPKQAVAEPRRAPAAADAGADDVVIPRKSLDKILGKIGENGNGPDAGKDVAYMIEKEAKAHKAKKAKIEASGTVEELTNKTLDEALTDADFFASPVYSQGMAVLNAAGAESGDAKSQGSWWYIKKIGATVKDAFDDAKREFGTGPALAIATVYSGILSLAGMPLVDKVLPKQAYALIPVASGAAAYFASFGIARAIKGIYHGIKRAIGAEDSPKDEPKAEPAAVTKKPRKPRGKKFADGDFTGQAGKPGFFAGVSPDVILQGVRRMEAIMAPTLRARGVSVPRLTDEQILGFFNYVYGRRRSEGGKSNGPNDDAHTFADTTESHEFSSTQFEVSNPAIVDQLRRMSRMIPDEDLAEEGRETKPHITVKFGLHADAPDELVELLRGYGPVDVVLGKTSIFSNDDADVVKVDVEGDDIHRLNQFIASHMECTDTHPEYIPHLTLAYVKPGFGDRYSGLKALDGVKIRFRTLTFSDKFRDKTPISLTDLHGFADGWTAARSRTGSIKATKPGERPLYGHDAEVVLRADDDGAGPGAEKKKSAGLKPSSRDDDPPRRILDQFVPHIASMAGPKEQKVQYANAVHTVASNMPAKAQVMFETKRWGARFFADDEQLRQAVINTYPEAKARLSGKTLALCVHDATGYTFYLDGRDQSQTIPEVYAHEFTHMLDAHQPDGSRKYSSMPDWQEAWAAEPTTRYSRTDAKEGFAEFGRLVYSGRYKLESVASKYPKCTAFFRSHGLFPGSSVGGQVGSPEEVFREKVPLGGNDNHADVVMDGTERDEGPNEPGLWGKVKSWLGMGGKVKPVTEEIDDERERADGSGIPTSAEFTAAVNAKGATFEQAPNKLRIAKVGGQRFLLKPVRGGEGGAKIEKMAADFARAAGVNVATVAERTVNGELTTVVRWLPNVTVLDKGSDAERAAALAKVPKTDIERQVLFDYVIGNTDKNDGNYLISNGRFFGIDKEFSLGDERGRNATTSTPPRFLRFLDPEGYGDNFTFDRTEIEKAVAYGERIAKQLDQSGYNGRAGGVRDRLKVLERFKNSPDLDVKTLFLMGKQS